MSANMRDNCFKVRLGFYDSLTVVWESVLTMILSPIMSGCNRNQVNTRVDLIASAESVGGLTQAVLYECQFNVKPRLLLSLVVPTALIPNYQCQRVNWRQ